MVVLDIKYFLDADISEFYNSKVTVRGWVRSKRKSKNVSFISINDGTTVDNIQIVFCENEKKTFDLSEISIGASISVKGSVLKSKRLEQKFEIYAEELSIIGGSDSEYSLQPKKHSFDFLRSKLSLRVRTGIFSSIFRIRSFIFQEIHTFFKKKDFVHINSPIITTTDGEGAGEMFCLTSLLNKKVKNNFFDFDFSDDLFCEKTFLSVTGQLEAEASIFGLNRVYTLGPTFRAENSNTTRHLSEFWMLEPEAAFYDLNNIIDLSVELLKHLLEEVSKNCPNEIDYLELRRDKIEKDHISLEKNLESVLNGKFVRINYGEAVKILIDSNRNSDLGFKYKIKKWGEDLKTEHEKFLADIYFKSPVVVTDYPSEMKAFYMRKNDDEKTVAAFDILFPGIGEVIGGSQREERYDKLVTAIESKSLDKKKLDWYIETRKYGTVPHSGFGLGIERLIMFITGIENIRDVIMYPKYPGRAFN